MASLSASLPLLALEDGFLCDLFVDGWFNGFVDGSFDSFVDGFIIGQIVALL